MKFADVTFRSIFSRTDTLMCPHLLAAIVKAVSAPYEGATTPIEEQSASRTDAGDVVGYFIYSLPQLPPCPD